MRKLIFTTIIILWQLPVLSGQQVWPGDINNNGIVNNIDVLYWAVAKDATGSGRLSPSTQWTGQNLPAVLWAQSFPNGLNYAYADCDGDGDVDDDDKKVIEGNFGLVHGTVTPDEYPSGNPALNPILQLSSDMAVVAPEGTLEADLSLGTETNSLSGFYGLAFTVVYDPDVVGNQGNDFRLNILEDTWMNGMGDDKVIQFINNDRINGIAQIAIVRKNQQPVSGYGEIGTFSIVMEDIVVGLSNIAVTDIKTVGLNLEDFPVAPSELQFSVDTTLTAVRRTMVDKGVKLYPNPATGAYLTIEMEDPAEQIRLVELFDVHGRLLSRWAYSQGQSKQQLALGQQTAGIYSVKILTDRRLYVRSFFR